MRERARARRDTWRLLAQSVTLNALVSHLPTPMLRLLMEWKIESERGELEVMKQRRWIESRAMRLFHVSTRQLLSAWRHHVHLLTCVPVHACIQT